MAQHTVELTEEQRQNLIACVRAELALLISSGKDYIGPLKLQGIQKLEDLLVSTDKVTLTYTEQLYINKKTYIA